MDIRKALEVAAEYRAEGKKWLALADEIETAAKKAANGTGQAQVHPANHPAKSRSRPNSYIAVAMEVLREAGHPMHVKDMLLPIGKRLGKDVARPNVEGALVRAYSQGKLKRPRPSTFGLP